MALVRGTTTQDRRIPSASSYTISHNQNTGTDRYLFVVITCPATSVSSVTYGGTGMTLVQRRSTPYSTDWTVWRLAAPATGTNTLQVNMGTANYNGVSTFIVSFTGCSGVGNTAYNGSQLLPTTTNITIQQNAMVIGSVLGGNATNANIEIPQGTARTLLYNHNVNNYTWGSVSPSLNSGTITLEGNSTATMIIMATEVREAVTVVVPTLTTTAASSITSTSASSGGTSINAGGGTITAKGVCWSTSQNPTTANSNTNNGTGTTNFTSSITGLSPNTTYYVRAYATNSAGTGYGNQISFTTLTPTLIASLSTLTGFTYQEGSGPSLEQSFSLAGQDLIANTIITAPTNYEISKISGGPFSSSITETLTSYSYSVYVRLKAGLLSGTYNGEIINITSTGAASQTVTLDGEVTALSNISNNWWLIF